MQHGILNFETVARIFLSSISKIINKEKANPPNVKNPYIFLHGQSNLLKDEIISKDLDQIRNLFDEIEQKSSLVEILETAGKAKGVQIFIA